MSSMNQFILMLAKLRQNLDYFPLSKVCGVSESTAQNIFITWVHFCSRQWGEMNLWSARDLTSFHAPEDFKVKFPTTWVIVDGTEIPILQILCHSGQPSARTKIRLVGSTPGGLNSYLLMVVLHQIGRLLNAVSFLVWSVMADKHKTR